MNTTENTPHWAIIELMGHVRYGGLVSKDNQFGTAMLRVDVPQKDGSFVSQLVNPSSLYRVTMCDEQLARAAAEQGDSKPLDSWSLRHLLPPPSPDKDAAIRELQHALQTLNFKVNSGYDFNADPENVTRIVGEALQIQTGLEDDGI